MSFLDTVTEDLKAAMKAKDEATLSTVRMLKSALKNKQIDLMRELTEEDAFAVVKTQIKQLKDAAETFAAGGRPDLAASSAKEIAVLAKYLPAQLDDAMLQASVKHALAAAGISSKADAGKAMGIAMKATAGKADAGRVKAVVESLLAVFVLGLVFHAALPAQALAADAYNPLPYIAYALRAARVFMLLAGLVAVNTLITGSFGYMVASGRDENLHHAHKQMISGILGTIIIAGLFIAFTVALQDLPARSL